MKHLQRVLAPILLLACQRADPPPPRRSSPPTPTPVVLDSAVQRVLPPSPQSSADAGEAADRTDWSEAYASTPLPDARVLAFQLAAQSGAGETAEHAAFVLGRRLPIDRIPAVLSVLPTRLHATFARGACGRSADQQPPSLPSTLTETFAQPHPNVALATWVFRSRRAVPGMTAERVRRLLASDRADDQLAGARLLVTAEPPFDLIEHLRPLAMAAAFRAIALRNSSIPDRWHHWIDSVALRARSNLRAWGNTWLALVEAAPRTDPEVRTALLAALTLLRGVTSGDPNVDAAFRCPNAAIADAITGQIASVDTCADEANHWRSLVARVRYVKERPTDVQRASILLQVLHDAAGDARVLEAIPSAAVELPPGLARPVFQQYAGNRDPGVLAAVLEQLALHVQHARGLPGAVRDPLLRAPFVLDEALSLEARQQSIALSRALGLALPPTSQSTVRAMQQAMQPDASVAPARSPVQPNSLLGRLVVTTHTGRVVIEVSGDSATEATRVVIEAARGGRYNGTSFHRVVPAFVAQGGDPRGDGYGGTSTIVPTELSGMPFDRGAVGIALAGLDTGGMQFFVVTADAPHLDARYPWIGRVVEGMEVVDELMEGDAIERVEFVER